MKKCPNTDIKKCKAKSHATDALYCHLCGARLIDDNGNTNNNAQKPNSGLYGTSSQSSTSTASTNNYSDNDVDTSKLIKWLIAVLVIVGIIVLIVSFWQEIIHFIGAVIVIIIILAVIVSSN